MVIINQQIVIFLQYYTTLVLRLEDISNEKEKIKNFPHVAKEYKYEWLELEYIYRERTVLIDFGYETWKDAITYLECIDKDVSKKLHQLLTYGVSFFEKLISYHPNNQR